MGQHMLWTDQDQRCSTTAQSNGVWYTPTSRLVPSQGVSVILRSPDSFPSPMPQNLPAPSAPHPNHFSAILRTPSRFRPLHRCVLPGKSVMQSKTTAMKPTVLQPSIQSAKNSSSLETSTSSLQREFDNTFSTRLWHGLR